MKKSSSRPRLSQPSGDGSQTVEIFFHSAHFPILGELTKIGVKNVSTLQTISSIRWTFWGIFSSQTFCVFLTNSDEMSRCKTFLSSRQKHVPESGQTKFRLPAHRRAIQTTFVPSPFSTHSTSQNPALPSASAMLLLMYSRTCGSVAKNANLR